MATTGRGYPYPIGTDRVMDGDDAIGALAGTIDLQLGAACSGFAPVAVLAGASSGSVLVTFPAGRFKSGAPPIVVCTYNGTNLAWSLPNCVNISLTACTIGASHRDNTPSGAATTINMMYYAVQV